MQVIIMITISLVLKFFSFFTQYMNIKKIRANVKIKRGRHIAKIVSTWIFSNSFPKSFKMHSKETL